MKKEKLATCCYLLSPPLSPFSRLFLLFPHFLPVLSPSQPFFSRFPPLFSSIAERILLHGWLCLLFHSQLCPRALIQPGRVSSFFLFSFKECPVPNLSPVRLHTHNPLSIFTQNLIIFQNPPQTTPE